MPTPLCFSPSSEAGGSSYFLSFVNRPCLPCKGRIRRGLVSGIWNNSPASMNSTNDTIAAIATAPGESAIAVVRVAGPESLTIANQIFVCKGPPPSKRPANTFVHGRIVTDGAVADEVILLIYRAPQSYTREDAVEIQGHGGSTAAKRILRAVLDAGARPAEAGEFTKRAFLSGRLDLLQAEAVMDLIGARSDRAASAALEQLGGTLSRSFNEAYDAILAVAGELEATLDFSEDELSDSIMDGIGVRLRHAEQLLKELLATWDEGHLLREGARVVISGKPNVGKSTLLNALLGIDRAIVTHIPGTTRDVIEEEMVIDGYQVRIVDTAGLRTTDCQIEGEGIRRARKAIQQADVILHLIDGSAEMDAEDVEQLKRIPTQRAVIVINKTDLGNKVDVSAFASDQSVVCTSLLQSTGLDGVRRAIIDKLGADTAVQPHAVISERHRRLVVSALKDATEAALLLERDPAEPALSASKLRSALESLGEATGRVYHEELLNHVFSRFCIGK